MPLLRLEHYLVLSDDIDGTQRVLLRRARDARRL